MGDKSLASRLRHQVTIRRLQESKNAKGGGYTSSWRDVATVFAEVIGLKGGETVLNQVLQGIATYRVTIRWRADVAASDQLRHGGLDLNIRSAIDPSGRREELVIIADTGSTR